jgi:hypothetical protein
LIHTRNFLVSRYESCHLVLKAGWDQVFWVKNKNKNIKILPDRKLDSERRHKWIWKNEMIIPNQEEDKDRLNK